MRKCHKILRPAYIDHRAVVSKELERRLNPIDISVAVPCLQKAVLQGTAFVLKRVLGIPGLG